MKQFLQGTWLLLATLCVQPSRADACTTFCLREPGATLIGKSYDWHISRGRVYVNKRGVSKKAIAAGSPVSWTSKLGSVTFNQYGREFPNGGMNEAGLVVEIMWLDSSTYPSGGSQRAINELQWIQYQLDTQKSLAGVKNAARSMRVTPIAGKVHYMVCDKEAKCGVFEYIGGKLVISDGNALPHPVLTNDTYRDSLRHARKYQKLGGNKAAPKNKSSKSRFVMAALGARAGVSKSGVAGAFELLDRVKNGSYSKWQIVYDNKRRRIHFRSLGHPSIKSISLGGLDFRCATPVKSIDLNTDAEGDISAKLTPYDPADNRKLVIASLKDTGVPSLVGRLAASYPQSTRCKAR